MEALVSLGAAFAFALVFRTPLVRWPVAFYVFALAVDVAYASGLLAQVVPDLARALMPYLRRCTAAYGLFAIVMFMGVLPERSRLRAYLKPVRGSLSVLAALLVACHVVGYGSAYANVALSGFATASIPTKASLFLAVGLVIVLALLFVTSFRMVKGRMRAKAWARVQRLAYPFFVLISLHAAILLLPSCAAGGKSTVSVAVYLIVLVAYAMLRIARWVSDARAGSSQALPTSSQVVRTG